jgi:hypothetical protein
VPSYSFGIPDSWANIDPNDPPIYESEAAYLERNGLFLPSERTRLTKRDIEAEVIEAG